MNTYKQIIKHLEQCFDSFDRSYISMKIEDYEMKQKGIQNWWKAPTRINGYTDWDELNRIGGGKSLTAKLSGINLKMAQDMAIKDAEAIIKSRNSKMAKKLEDFGINEIYKTNLIMTSNGFDGHYNVRTDKGDKVIRIQTVLCGGYNIQALHYRTLVNISK